MVRTEPLAPLRPQSSDRSRGVTLGEAARFFLPLMLTAELMMISHAIISAVLARVDDPESALAAYSIAFHLNATLGSPLWACQVIAVSYIRDRASFWRMISFSVWLGLPLIVVWCLIGVTPLGDWVYGTIFGAGPEVVRAAKICTLIFTVMIIFVIPRSAVYGLLIAKRRTILVTYGSILRLATLGLLLFFFWDVIQGAELGAAAIVICVVVETFGALLIGRPYLKALSHGERPPEYKDMWKFSWPIMFMHLSEWGVIFVLNMFLGRLTRPELALAAFGFLDSLLRVLLSPTRNIIPLAQTLVRSRRDLSTVLLFSGLVGAGFAGIMLLLLFEPIESLILTGVMGLPRDMAAYVAPSLLFGALLALVMTSSALTRGLLINAKRTGYIAFSSAGRLAVVIIVGTIAILLDMQNGALIGISALIAAFAFESVLLTGRLLRVGTLPARE